MRADLASGTTCRESDITLYQISILVRMHGVPKRTFIEPFLLGHAPYIFRLDPVWCVLGNVVAEITHSKAD